MQVFSVVSHSNRGMAVHSVHPTREDALVAIIIDPAVPLTAHVSANHPSSPWLYRFESQIQAMQKTSSV